MRPGEPAQVTFFGSPLDFTPNLTLIPRQGAVAWIEYGWQRGV
jgi:hypothetical protein